MLIKGFAVVARFGRSFLIGVLALEVILAIVANRHGWGPAWWAFAVMMGLAAVMLVLSMAATFRYHPAVLFARPDVPAFVAPAHPARALLAAGVSAPMIGTLTDNVGDVAAGDDLWALDLALGVLVVGALALHLYLAGKPLGVQLRPDGVYDLQPLGSRFVPWEAFAPDFPAVPVRSNQLALYVQHPESVRVRGFHQGGGMLTTTTHAPYLATAIHQYVTRPELRGAIGTPAELHRLAASLAA